MKKRTAFLAPVLCAALILSACGGSSGGKEMTTAETTAETQTTTEEETPAPIANEKPVYLYYIDYGTNMCELVTEYNAPWSSEEDLACFGAFNTDVSEFYFETEKYAHLDLWDAAPTEAEYKIGYEISFDVNGEHKVITILDPQDVEDAPELFMGDVDTEEVTGYMGVWLYDDVHQEDGAWYSHVLPEEVTEETLLTSIKLRPTPASSEISNFELTVFSWSNPLEFDKEGHYNNSYGYTVKVNNGY